MKKVVLIFALVAVTFALFSCKDSSGRIVEPSKKNEGVPEQQLALTNLSENNEELPSNYRYVTAMSGLSLREFNNLQSDKLAKMPYGTKVKIISSEGKQTMNISGIKGGMDEIEFNHKKGFAFNGFLSKYFPPEKDITVKGYAGELQKQFPLVTYSEITSGKASNPITTEILSLPDAEWHEAFFIAQQLFDFPKEFDFPNPKGKDSEVIIDNKPKKGIWVSQLEIKRKDNLLQEIEYLYSSAKFTSKITLVPDGTKIKLIRTEELR